MGQTIVRRAGSEDPILFTLRHDSNGDGRIDAAINLSSVQAVHLHLQRKDGTVISFATNDPNPKLSIVEAAAGTLRLSPDSQTWQATDGFYRGYFVIVDATGKDIPVTEHDEFHIEIRPNFA